MSSPLSTSNPFDNPPGQWLLVGGRSSPVPDWPGFNSSPIQWSECRPSEAPLTSTTAEGGHFHNCCLSYYLAIRSFFFAFPPSLNPHSINWINLRGVMQIDQPVVGSWWWYCNVIVDLRGIEPQRRWNSWTRPRNLRNSFVVLHVSTAVALPLSLQRPPLSLAFSLSHSHSWGWLAVHAPIRHVPYGRMGLSAVLCSCGGQWSCQIVSANNNKNSIATLYL